MESTTSTNEQNVTKENTENELMNIPEDYTSISRWIKKNQAQIMNNPGLIQKILNRLEKLLKKTSQISDLRKDISIFLQTIKLEYDALLKEYDALLTIHDIVEMVNNAECMDFFSLCYRKEQSAKFVDVLYLEVEHRDRKVGERKVYDENSSEIKKPSNLKEIEEKIESNEEAKNIAAIIRNRKRVSFIELVCDPNSFGKTVYNAFNLSMAIRMKYVSFARINGILYVVESTNSDEEAIYEHGVFEITHEKYKEMRQKINQVQSQNE
ncbi:hypothetical protein ECANGB1_1381 [Enterospora canceri]|uniref:Non-structural maintenance of chromosomes element 4 n=1 Tax=Enterospora canceri TaxID=1081671 RepID=A0A1Y1S656_9MICR|nr:hypothetical protein ECANGB1_1381 [Enterospora canceri]